MIRPSLRACACAAIVSVAILRPAAAAAQSAATPDLSGFWINQYTPDLSRVLGGQPQDPRYARKAGGDAALQIGQAALPPELDLIGLDDFESDQHVERGDDIARSEDLGHHLGHERHQRVETRGLQDHQAVGL